MFGASPHCETLTGEIASESHGLLAAERLSRSDYLRVMGQARGDVRLEREAVFR